MPELDPNGNLCGSLHIEDPESGGPFKKCYCVLNNDKNELECYQSYLQYMNDPLSKNVHKINMRYVSLVSDASKLKLKVPHCFCMTVSGSRIYLATDAAEDKKTWMLALQKACRIMTVAERCSEKRDTSTELSYKAEIVAGALQKTPIDFQGDSSSDEIEHDMDTDSDDGGFNKMGDVGFTKPRNLDPIRVGFCIKQGFVRKNWKKRYFILDEDGISYYKKSSQDNKPPIKTVHKGEVVIARKSIGVYPNKCHVFELVTGKRVFYIQAPSEDEMIGWVQDINRYLMQKHSKEPEPQSSGSNTFPRSMAAQKSLSLNVRENESQTTATLEQNARGGVQSAIEPASNGEHEVNKHARFTWV